MKKSLVVAMVAGSIIMAAPPVFAEELRVTMNLVTDQGVGKAIGTVTISEGSNGLIFTPNLTGLTPGLHGFHVHQNPDCSVGVKDGKIVAALAAGGHYDPTGTGKHEGPEGQGHLGDLSALTVGADSTASTAVTAQRLTMSDVKGRSIMIHAGGDNYSDQPAALGGGGARIACGVVR